VKQPNKLSVGDELLVPIGFYFRDLTWARVTSIAEKSIGLKVADRKKIFYYDRNPIDLLERVYYSETGVEGAPRWACYRRLKLDRGENISLSEDHFQYCDYGDNQGAWLSREPGSGDFAWNWFKNLGHYRMPPKVDELWKITLRLSGTTFVAQVKSVEASEGLLNLINLDNSTEVSIRFWQVYDAKYLGISE
jgi:hypothetical protein